MCQSTGSIDVSKNAKLSLPVCLKENRGWGIKDGEVRCNVLYADRIYTLVKKPKKIGEYTLYRGACIGVPNVITDGKHYAHYKGDIREGIIDLRFKTQKRDKRQYSDLSLTSKIKYEDAVIMYRIITGACREGINQFLKSIKIKDEYTVQEIIELTEKEYGNTVFKNFFKKKI